MAVSAPVVLPDFTTFSVGALTYQGTWNASTNSPTLASGVGVKGQYYVVATAGTTSLDSHASWSQYDAAIFNGTAWDIVQGGITSGEVVTALGYTPVNKAGDTLSGPLIATDITANGNLISNGGFLRAAAGSKLGGGTDGKWQFANNGGTLGVTWDFSATDGSVKLADRAGTGEGKLFVGGLNYLGAATGLVNVLVVTSSPAVLALIVGCEYTFQANITNTTTTPTLNISGLGAKTIVKRAATALAAGDYVANMMCKCIWDGTNMQLINPVVN